MSDSNNATCRSSYVKKTMLELCRLSPEDYRRTDKLPVTVILDNVRSEMNVGSIFRTADAFLVEHICLCGITSVPPAPEIHKTALGAEQTVAWSYHDSVDDALKWCRERGHTVWAVEQAHGSTSLERWLVPQEAPVAVILGNEVKGVQQQAIDACDGCIEIPQCGTKHSLNVANTAAIVLWHLFNALR